MKAGGGPEGGLIKSAYGALRRLLKNLGSDYKLSDDRLELVVIDALKQHGDHLQAHRIEQRSIDAFKLVCWLGGSLLDGIDKDADRDLEIVINALIRTLNELLVIETKSNLVLPGTAGNLLKSLLIQEKKGNFKHGIWTNGLYVAFHCGIVAFKEGQAYKNVAL